MLDRIKLAIERINNLTTFPIRIVSHFDTDGIASAAIFSRALQRWNKTFTLSIVKSLDEDFIKNLPEDNLLIFLDLASGSLKYLKDKKNPVIILDHHEITQEIPENVLMVNPSLENQESLCSAAICYFFAKSLSEQNKDLSTLALIGMIGDNHQDNIGKRYDEIIKDADAVIKKGLLIYPSTRPLDKALEYSSSPYIPNVTGSYKGVIELLREANIPKNNGAYKALYELTNEEMTNLTTSIILKNPGKIESEKLIGNLYLLKFHNRLEDARELSALINACSRMGYPFVSLGFCLGNKSLKSKAEKIYIEYRQHLVSALKYIAEAEKITGKNYTIINAKNNIRDTIIGTVASIISRSPLYSEGTIIVALAYNEDKIKVSARITGKDGRNVREVLDKVVVPLGGEVGGHPNAAGCLISKDKEVQFIQELQKVLDIELVKV
ncbi:MAG: DHH family phosphoesterase [Nanoarchaeota archaeon]|nr:DHH family phosphoesterase [Nanoarchaeota archaeon]